MTSGFTVYVHLRADTGGIFYVGKGRLKRAHNRHGRNKYWKRVVNKAGGFSVTILQDSLSEEEAHALEVAKIAEFRSMGIRLCNITAGGEGVCGLTHSEESKQKMSKSKTGVPSPLRGTRASEETRLKLRLAHLGKKLSPEHVAKVAEANRGKVRSPEWCAKLSRALTGKTLSAETRRKLSIANAGFTPVNRKPVLCVTTGEVFESTYAAGRHFGLWQQNISKVCNGFLRTTGNLRFSYDLQTPATP